MNTVETLIKARSLIEDPKNWNRNGLFNSKSWFGFGREKYCILGAVNKVTGQYFSDAHNFIYGAFIDMKNEGLISPDLLLVLFNDHEATHVEILAIFDRAIKNAREV